MKLLRRYKKYCYTCERRYLLVICSLCYCLFTTAQNTTLELTFTGVDNLSYARLDSIKVINRTQNTDTVLYWPDTTLTLKLIVGQEYNDHWVNDFSIRCFPNPSQDQATIKLQIPKQGMVVLNVFDIFGRKLLTSNKKLSEGIHSFRFMPGDEGVYIIAATFNSCHRTTKLINFAQNQGSYCSISYWGYSDHILTEKSILTSPGFEYYLGDTLMYIGYVDTLESGILDSPDSSQTYLFQFAYDIPCPGIPTVFYEGQVYNTVQVFSQCWLKENLNVGIMIPGDSNMTDNGIIEKYCFNNEEDTCTKYGGLYLWNELMQYTTAQGSRGICPPGWHIPTDDNWKILEGAVDSQYDIGDEIWELETFRGFDVAKNLKSTSNWNSDGNGLDTHGFRALPGGARFLTGAFLGIGNNAFFRLSTETVNNPGSAWNRGLFHDYDEIYRSYSFMVNGGSVRCIRD